MTLQELTSHLQTLCHEGHSQDKVIFPDMSGSADNIQIRVIKGHEDEHYVVISGDMPTFSIPSIWTAEREPEITSIAIA